MGDIEPMFRDHKISFQYLDIWRRDWIWEGCCRHASRVLLCNIHKLF